MFDGGLPACPAGDPPGRAHVGRRILGTQSCIDCHAPCVQAGGNTALALMLLVVTNVLAVFIAPFLVKAILASRVDASQIRLSPTGLLVDLVITILTPALVGKACTLACSCNTPNIPCCMYWHFEASSAIQCTHSCAAMSLRLVVLSRAPCHGHSMGADISQALQHASAHYSRAAIHDECLSG